MKILGISGSVFGTKSRIALDTFKTNFSPEVEYEIMDLKDLNIEFSDGRDYRDYTGDTKILIDKILEVDAILIGSPVFQASIPGALKNVFDLLPIDSLRNKVVGIVMSAGSSKHFLVTEYQLKPILTYMKAKPLENFVFIEGSSFNRGAIINDDINLRLENYAKTMEAAVRNERLHQESEDALFDF